jgi:glycosyltransferase involved in cell wall biosynthesis
MPTPFFSIVVPTWNSGNWIGETISSLLNQNFPSDQHEIIVVDDGSTDETLNRLERFSNRIRIFQQQNLGAASARNRGMQHARGEYIVCFDHDDILMPNALTVYKRVIDAFERPPVVLAQATFFSGRTTDLTPAKPSRVECIKCKDFFGKTVPTVVLNSILILRKDRVLSVGGYSPDIASYDDHDLLFKLGNASPMVKIVQPITVGYRLHGRNATRDLEFVTQGTLAFIRNERRGLYPGGSRRMLDRRGLIGSNVLRNCYSHYLKARQFSLRARLSHIVRLLLYTREMIVAAVIRNWFSYFYSKEVRLLDRSHS